MDEKTEKNLENPENWDYTSLQARQPVKSARIVISVAFPREDFETVSRYAESLGKKVSEFVRQAALDKAKNRGMEIIVSDFGSTGPLWFERNLPSSTRVNTLLLQDVREPAGVTSG